MSISSAYSEQSVTAVPDTLLTQDSYTVGTHILFGRYEQDDDISNGQEPLEWIILDRTGDKVFLITKDIIDFGGNCKTGIKGDAQPYRWSNCTLRQWLNDEYISTTFTEDEQTAIISTTVKAEKSPFNNYAIGQDTQDRVFIMSYSESNRYFLSDEDRSAEPSISILRHPYTSVGQIWHDDIMYETNKRGITSYTWSLRAPGKDTYTVIGADGKAVKSFGWYQYVGVRPVCWVDLSKTKNTIKLPIEESVISPEIAVGTEMKFGKYQQSNYTNIDKKPIEWTVIARENNKILLLSKQVLAFSTYANAKRSTWDQSIIREWLSNTLLNTAFNDQEQQAMAIRTVLAERSGAGKLTHDKLFLLSRTEIERYIPDSGFRIASSKEYTADQSTASCLWWLRSSSNGSRYADVVSTKGEVNHVKVDTKELIGVRPALWLNLDQLNHE